MLNEAQNPDNLRFSNSDQPMEPLACLWDWVFGSRLLARCGSQDAKIISKESPLVNAVSEWRDKVADAKKSRVQREFGAG